MRLVWLVLLIVAGAAAACALDMPVFRVVKQYVRPHTGNHLVRQFIGGFQTFAELVPILAASWLTWRLDPRHGRQAAVRLVVVALLGLIVSGGAKAVVGRYRPGNFTEQTWRQAWIDAGPADRGSKQQSFFSGHSAAAFGIATVLNAYYPPVRPVVYTLATGCAASRVVTENHWLSDVYIGSIAGIALGWLFLPGRLRRARRDKGLLQGKLTGQLVGPSQN